MFNYDEDFFNEQGNRHGVHTRTIPYEERIEYIHSYVNGELMEVQNFTLSVEGIKPLIGRYQNGNPYEGYFVYQNEMEIPMIDYFESGILQAQYTTTLRELIESEYREEVESENRFNLTKTFFKNGSAWEGLVHKGFKISEAHLLATEYLREGKIEKVDLWLMAVHYAELIQLEFIDHGYRIYKEAMPNLEDEAIDGRARSIEVRFTNDSDGSLNFSVESDSIVEYKFQTRNIESPFLEYPGNILYQIDFDSIQYLQRFGFQTNQELYKQSFNYNPHIISSVYMYLSHSEIPKFAPIGENDYASLFKADSKSNFKKMLFLNQQGKPFRGSFVERDVQTNTYRYTHFEDSKGEVLAEKIDLEKLKNKLDK